MNSRKISDEACSYSRVSKHQRKSFFSVTLVRVGVATSLAQFMLGATLGHSMTLPQAMLATFFGSLILIFVGFGIGYAGMREGLSTYVLTQWCGFGRTGAILISLVLLISLLGWFGVNISLIAQSLASALDDEDSFSDYTLLTGLIFTALVAFGFKGLSITATLSVPLFLMVILYLSFREIPMTSSGFAALSPAGEALSIGEGATMVAGLYITGALIMPDVSRYCRNGKDLFWMVTLSVLVGECIVSGIGMLVAQALGTKDVVTIMLNSAGYMGFFTVILSAIKVNDINLYSSSLSLSALSGIATGRSFNFTVITICLGIIGTLLALSGIINNFTFFLITLGLIFSPIAGVILVDYYILRTSREILDTTRLNGTLPGGPSTFFTGWAAITACVSGIAGGWLLRYGIASFNSLIIAGVIYWCLMQISNRISKEKK